MARLANPPFSARPVAFTSRECSLCASSPLILSGSCCNFVPTASAVSARLALRVRWDCSADVPPDPDPEAEEEVLFPRPPSLALAEAKDWTCEVKLSCSQPFIPPWEVGAGGGSPSWPRAAGAASRARSSRLCSVRASSFVMEPGPWVDSLSAMSPDVVERLACFVYADWRVADWEPVGWIREGVSVTTVKKRKLGGRVSG